MTAESASCPPVRTKPPPPWVVHRAANPLLRRLVPSQVGRWLPGVAVLRFHGRRTGREYSVPIGIYDYEGAQVVFTEGRWMANFRGGAPVDVIRRGRTTKEHGELVTDPAYIGPAIRAALDAGTTTIMLGMAIDKNHRPTDIELAAIRRAVVIRPTLKDRDTPESTNRSAPEAK